MKAHKGTENTPGMAVIIIKRWYELFLPESIPARKKTSAQIQISNQLPHQEKAYHDGLHMRN